MSTLPIGRPLRIARRMTLDEIMRPRLWQAKAQLARIRVAAGRMVPESAPLLPLIGDIGESDPVNAAQVRRFLARLKPGQGVRVRLDSNGGSVAEAQAIARLLRAHKGGVRCTVKRRAHSAAALILAACHYRVAAGGARFLLHEMEMLGDLPDRITAAWLQRRADRMRETQDAYIAALASATRAGPEFWSQSMRAARELTAREALTLGLVHEVT